MRICSVQMQNSPIIDANINRITKFLTDASGKECTIAVFPECAITGFNRKIVSSLKYPQKIEDALATIGNACKSSNITAIVGTPIRERNEWYNGAVIFGDNGEQIARIGKRNLTSPEATIFKSRTGSQSFEIEGVKCGVIFCKEAHNPEIIIKELKINNVSILFWLSYYLSVARDSHGQVSSENNCVQQGIKLAQLSGSYVIQSNWANSADDKTLSLGSSVIVSPNGTLLAQGEIGKEQLLIVEINPCSSPGT